MEIGQVNENVVSQIFFNVYKIPKEEWKPLNIGAWKKKTWAENISLAFVAVFVLLKCIKRFSLGQWLGVNFTNVLRAAFTYVSCMCSFSFCAYVLGLYFTGARLLAQKLRVECWWNWPYMIKLRNLDLRPYYLSVRERARS
jgi:hypothetical protein